MTKIVVIVNFNQTFIKELHKEMLRYQKQKKHITQTKQKMESMSRLVLIPDKESFFYYNQQEATLDRY
jgi:hypothetical protein